MAELYTPFTPSEFMIGEAIGLSENGKAAEANREGRFDMDGEVPINLSGGTLCANPIAVTALARVAEAALQLHGTAGDRQVPDAESAVTTGPGGSHQFHSIATFQREKPEQ